MSKARTPDRSKLAFGAFVGLAVLGAVVWGLLASSGSDGELEASAPLEETAAAPEPDAALTFADAQAESDSATQEPAARVALATPPQLVMERPRIIHGGEPIEGLFYLGHLNAPNGQVLAPRVNFVLEVAFEGAVRSLDVEVVRGAWSCELPVPFRDVQRLEVRSVQIDGRRCDGRAALEPNIGGEVLPSLFVARGQCAWDAQLEVVDALSKRSLPTALVVPVEANQQVVPSNMGLEITQPLRETPLDLAPLANSMTEQAFFVSSPGYAWQRIVVDLRRETFQRVELLPGGELFVHGSAASGQLELVEVGPAGPGRRVALLNRFALPQLIRGLPAGEYELRTPVDEPPVKPVDGSPRGRVTLGKITLQTPEGSREFEAVEFVDGRFISTLGPDGAPAPSAPIQLRATITAGARTELVLDR
ncbi:MAG: hypothetical protein HUU28_03765 [Planctomycetaceae bacterium]|nr:hypothetical protein [Planctomycetaceae bacterium]